MEKELICFLLGNYIVLRTERWSRSNFHQREPRDVPAPRLRGPPTPLSALSPETIKELVEPCTAQAMKDEIKLQDTSYVIKASSIKNQIPHCSLLLLC